MGSRDPQQEQYIHLVRLGWDLRVLGVPTSLVVPATGPPVLELMSTADVRVRVQVTRRACGWAFVWRPWWSVLWRRGEWVWAEADNAADMIVSAVTG
ncbi:hypothetical protein OG339_33225 [Streptosporangium sp. NBC_01495]|uniref:hypothetical protein n=1 Tax=Streptosporangium sp. NBC_01495 TaxID=2903899 RepID=UPI002E312EE4|nr:hypothetical protein [Streptosporangium sp. NBC_01495]